MRNPRKERSPRHSRFYQYCICSLHVDHRRNNRHAWWSHYANWCTSTRRICRNDWPYRSSTRFLRPPIFNRRSKHQVNPSWSPRFGAALADENSCQKGLEKQTLRMPLSLPLSSLVSSPSYSCYLALSESLATFSVVLPFLPIHSNCFGSHQTQKMYPDKKVTFRVAIWSCYPSSSCCGISILMIVGDNLMNFVWVPSVSWIASGLYFVSTAINYIKSKTASSLIFFIDTRWETETGVKLGFALNPSRDSTNVKPEPFLHTMTPFNFF